MTSRMVLSNLGSFGLQVTVLVAAGAALARVFRLDRPSVALVYWRVILFVCLVLPLCQPWHTVVPPTLTSPAVGASETVGMALTQAAATPRSVTWRIGDLVLIALGSGILARVLWLTIGAFSLHRLRRDATPLEPLPPSVQHAQERIGTRAGMFVSHRVAGPITFGVLRPIVVFPPSVSTLPAHVQEAIACHELIHVQRRDWLDEIVEEIVRSVLWFHPVIWWLIGHIQLTREQVVDQEAIRLTNSRARYIESLLAVALAGSPGAFTPASSFLRRHLLKKRVARILQETTMTTRRLVASLIASTAVLVVAAVVAVRAFPLEAQGRPSAHTGEPIQLIAGAEHLLHGERPEYPRRAIDQKIEGDVIVDLTLNDRGEVSDARVVSGPEELRKATLEAVLRWHYSPSAIRSTVTQAILRFHLPAGGLQKVEPLKDMLVFADDAHGRKRLLSLAPVPHDGEPPMEIEPEPLVKIDQSLKQPDMNDVDRAELEAKQLEMAAIREKFHADAKALYELSDEIAFKLERRRHALHTFEGAPRLVDVRTERVSAATAQEVLAQAGVAVGDSISEETAKRIRQAALQIDEHLHVGFQRGHNDGLVLTILAK